MKRRSSLTSVVMVALTILGPMGVASALESTSSKRADTAALPSGVIALVNGVAIPQTEVPERIRAMGWDDSLAARDMVRSGLIARELIRQAAELEKMGNAPQLKGMAGAARVDAEDRLYLDAHLHPQPITDADVRARYDAIVAEEGPMEYRARLIVVADSATAETVLGQLKSGTAFEKLAAQYSIDPTRVQGGMMPWISFKVPPVEWHTMGVALPLAQEIARLHPGQVSTRPIVVGGKYMLVKLDASRPTVIPTFEQATPELRKSLDNFSRNQAFMQLVNRLAVHAVVIK